MPRRFHGLPPSRPFPFGPLAAGGAATAAIVGGGGVWTGQAIEETTGLAVARLVVDDSQGLGAGTRLAPFTLAASESRFDPPAGNGILFESGIFLTATAGTVAGVIYVVELSPDELRLYTRMAMDEGE